VAKLILNSLRQRLIVLSATSIFLIPHFTYAQSLGALIPDFRVNDDLTNYTQEGPSIGVDGNGNFIIVWGDQRNTPIGLPYQSYCQRFSFDGTRLGNNFKIGPDTAGAGHIAVLNDGRFIVTWGATVNAKPDIYFQRFLANGTPNGGMFKVNDTNVVGAYATSMDISADSVGNFIIVWTDYRNGTLNPDVYGQRFDSAGNRIGSNFRINDNTNNTEQGAPRVAVNKVGSFVICWNDWRSTNAGDIYMQRYDRYGNIIGVNQRVDDDVTNAWQTICDIASDGRGHFVIPFDDYRDVPNKPHVYYQVYDSLGNKIGINRKADENIGQTSAGATKVSMQSNGKFVIMWSDERYNNFIQFAQRFNKDGTKIGVNFKIPELNSSINYGSEDIYLFGDRIYSTWNDTRNGDYDIFANVKSFRNPDSVLAGISSKNEIALQFTLYPVYPNPFNPKVTINYQVRTHVQLKLIIYDIEGREIKVLKNANHQPGFHKVEWEGPDYPSGLYFVRLETEEGYYQTQKIILLK